jgi:hypothetical protein
MDEAEWQTCNDLAAMLEFLRGKASERKLRLFACACCRRIWHFLSDKRSQLAVEVGEKCADGKTTDEEQFNAYEAACAAKYDAWCVAYENGDFPAVAASYVLGHDPSAALVASTTVLVGDDPRGRKPKEMAFQGNLLRDIFGNPFRPVAIDPACRAAVTNLATAAYEERHLPAGHLDPDRQAVLADALEDAGCTDADILGHLRDPGPHVRGCWVLDLLLGKE